VSPEQKQEIEYPEFPDYVTMEERSEMYRSSLILLNLRMLRMDFKAHPQLFTAAEFAGSCSSSQAGVWAPSTSSDRSPSTSPSTDSRCPWTSATSTSCPFETSGTETKASPKKSSTTWSSSSRRSPRVASFARENLIRTLELADQLPPQAHRAFLPLLEAEYYLETLEKYNFELFEKSVQKVSYITLPLRIRKAAASGRFTHFDLTHYNN